MLDFGASICWYAVSILLLRSQYILLQYQRHVTLVENIATAIH